MNATTLARTAYGSGAARSPRGVEYDAFARVTALLTRASDDVSRAAAIARNRQLWSLLATDVADDGNDLPPELRARIFYLSEFVTAESRKVLSGAATPDALIDINSIIMRSLAGTEAAA